MKYIIGLLLVLVAIKLYATNIKKNVKEELSLGEAINGSKSYFYNRDKSKIIYSYMGHTFLLGKNELSNVDIKSFTPIDNEYAYDKNHIYWKIFIIQGADKDSFVVVGEDYSKDKNSVFFEQNKIKEADSKTFKLGGRFQAEDAKYCYSKGKVVYTKVDRHWSFRYTESIDIKIKLLSQNISQSTDDIETLQNRKELQELLDKKALMLTIIKELDENKDVSSLLKSFNIEQVIEKAKKNINNKYILIASLYKFKFLIDKKKEDNEQVGLFLKKSIDFKADNRSIYDYAIWLYNTNYNSSIEYFKKLLSTEYREESLIKLSDIAFKKNNTKEALEYYSMVNTSNITDINTKQSYIQLLEKVVALDIKNKKFQRAKSNLNNVLAFYQNVAVSNPYVYEELASIYKQFTLIYKGLNNEKKRIESLEKAKLIYSSLNKAFPNKFQKELKELGE